MKRKKKNQLEININNCKPRDVLEDRLLKDRRESQVCRIHLRNKQLNGTGFLIGPRTILTNWHVFSHMRKDLEDVDVIFDYRHENDMYSIKSEVIRLSNDPLLAYSPYEEEEDAVVGELDYAVLTLEREIGLENGRGWAVLPSEAPTDWGNESVGEPVIILQHPTGEILRADFHVTAGLNKCENRVFYLASTDGGSSGAPCFNKEWEVVAMHQGYFGEQNKGIPVHLIRNDLVEKGKWDFLCAEEKQPKIRFNNEESKEGEKCNSSSEKSLSDRTFVKGLNQHFLFTGLLLISVVFVGGFFVMKSLQRSSPVVVDNKKNVEFIPEIGWKYLESSNRSSREIYGEDPFVIAKQKAKIEAKKLGGNGVETKQKLLQYVNKDIGLRDFIRKDFQSAIFKAREVSQICETQARHLTLSIQKLKSEIKLTQTGRKTELKSSKIKLQSEVTTWKQNRETWLYSLVIEGASNVALRRWKDAIIVLGKAKLNLDKEVDSERWCIVALALANALEKTGDYSKAKLLYKDVVKIREKKLGAFALPTLLAKHSLGDNLIILGDYLKARELVDKVIKELSVKKGKLNPLTLRAQNTMADTYIGKQEFNKAVEYLEKLSDALEDVVGPKDRAYLACRGNLTFAYLSVENIEKAERIGRENYSECNKKYGSLDPLSMTATLNLGLIHLYKEDYVKARDYLETAIKNREGYYGRTHSKTQWIRANMGMILFRSGRTKDAAIIIESVYNSLKKKLGEKHPRTLIMEGILAGIDLEHKQYKKCKETLIKLLPKQSEILGKENKYTLMSMVFLGNAYIALEEFQEADSLLNRVASIRSRKYGARHKSSLSCQLSLSDLYRAQGDFSNALKLSMEVVKIGEVEYGGKASLVLDAKNKASSLYAMLENFKKAKELMEPVYEWYKKKYGVNDWRTVKCMVNLGAYYIEVGDLINAEKILVSALGSFKNHFKTTDDEYYVCLINMADLHEKLGELKKAEEFYKLSMEGLSPRYDSNHQYIKEINLGMKSVEKKLLKQKNNE